MSDFGKKMVYHVVLNKPTDLVGISRAAEEGLTPRHSMAELARVLGAKTHDGSNATPGLIEKALGKFSRTNPLWWSIAINLRREVKSGDVVFCTGEDVGVPVAVMCGRMPGVRVTVMVHSADSVKKRLAFWLFGLKDKVSVFFCVARLQSKFLRERLKLAAGQVRFIWDQTDTKFFSPGPGSPDKRRPLIMSVGLERRDYTTLAKATADLDVDVNISGFSSDTRVISGAFPPELPANMTRRFYPWPDLLQLYRDADVVVVSVFPNGYAAGVQGLMEALSCGRPVVVTASEGLEGYLDDGRHMRVVPPGDADGMRRAILELLADDQERHRLSESANALAKERYRLERYVDEIAQVMRGLSGELTNNAAIDVVEATRPA